MNWKTIVLALAISTALAGVSGAADFTGPFEISFINSQTNKDAILVIPVGGVGALENPGGCPLPATGLGYSTDGSHPGQKLRHAMLLTAWATGQEVQVGLEGCDGAGRPLIAIVKVLSN